MPSIMGSVPDIDTKAGAAIAAAMRAVAVSDGMHPNEEALIIEFEESIGAGATTDIDWSVIDTPALKEALLKSCVLVAFADGAISDEETTLLHEYAGRLGLGEREVAKSIADVAQVLLSQLSGVKIFKDQVLELGRTMGLDELTIHSVLGD
ncbi:MAG: hypothetical protein GY913_24295 [Proteobacteria bacterium]|nr:hypothetical protein [Pseudomonadota bacterium]MCP4920036.1 hypothetical protein [Pseudomonadota bacterium]